MRTVLLTPALTVEERSFDVVDLVLAGLLAGIWSPFERSSAEGVAAELELDSRGAGPAPETLRAAADTYRRARGLLAREDLDRWLEARRLTVQDWHGHLRRVVAREVGVPAVEGDATSVLRVDAVCSGTLRDCANEVIAGAAAARGLREGDGEAGLERVARLVDLARGATSASGLGELDEAELERRARLAVDLAHARELLQSKVAGPEAVARCLASNSLEWLTFRTEELELADEDVAREARLCLQEDGAELAEVASLTGSVPTRRTWLFAESPEALRTRLVPAAVGDVVGPIALDGGYLVARLVEKTTPSTRDPAAVERARLELVAAAIRSRAAGRVTWHVAL